jgi:hypothetical protein
MQFCWIGLQIEAKNAGAVVLRRGFLTRICKLSRRKCALRVLETHPGRQTGNKFNREERSGWEYPRPPVFYTPKNKRSKKDWLIFGTVRIRYAHQKASLFSFKKKGKHNLSKQSPPELRAQPIIH